MKNHRLIPLPASASPPNNTYPTPNNPAPLQVYSCTPIPLHYAPSSLSLLYPLLSPYYPHLIHTCIHPKNNTYPTPNNHAPLQLYSCTPTLSIMPPPLSLLYLPPFTLLPHLIHTYTPNNHFHPPLHLTVSRYNLALLLVSMDLWPFSHSHKRHHFTLHCVQYPL